MIKKKKKFGTKIRIFSPPPPHPAPSAYLRNSLSFPQLLKDELSGVRMITHAQ